MANARTDERSQLRKFLKTIPELLEMRVDDLFTYEFMRLEESRLGHRIEDMFDRMGRRRLRALLSAAAHDKGLGKLDADEVEWLVKHLSNLYMAPFNPLQILAPAYSAAVNADPHWLDVFEERKKRARKKRA